MSTTNQTGLTKPAHITSLATSCILVSVDVRVWTATKQDKETAKEVTDGKKAEASAARVTQHLLADNPKHKAILNYRQTIYNWMERNTYPWSGSQSILPVPDLPVFMQQYQAHEQEFNKLKDDFLADYPSIISTMAFKMGDLFKRSSYPDVHDLQHKFGITLHTNEVPQGDFRVQISNELAADLHYNYERQATELVNGIISKQAEQLIQVMESISNCCQIEESIDEHGKLKIKRKKLYDSTIQRGLDLCKTYQSFNLTQNPDLEEARSKLEGILSGINIDALRESDSMRTRIKEDVDGILNKFGGGRI